MTDIPDDIMKAAWAVLQDEGHSESDAERIARAIMAERERCAKVADKAAADQDTNTRDHEALIQALAAEDIAHVIADAIRKGEA